MNWNEGDKMKFELNKDEVLQIAQAKFPGKYIELDTIDFYVPEIKEGIIQLEGMNQPFYISTNYAYEDRIVLGNNTRYKVELVLLYVKADRYEVMFDSYGKSYVAYEDDSIHIIAYEDFYDEIKKKITIIK